MADKVHRIENESWNFLNQPTDAQNQIIKVSVESHHKEKGDGAYYSFSIDMIL